MAGLLRSLVIYRRPFRQKGLRELYRGFVQPGDLVFDVGAHMGDRTRAFADLGATVVAFEPQPQLRALLTRLEARQPLVTVRSEAIGASIGEASLAISQATPTVSTMASTWRQGIGAANETFRNVQWEERVTVHVVTLDSLIARYGLPAFCKIDVEGYEPEVLAGLNRAIPALSIEFVAGSLDGTRACIQRLAELGHYEYNVILGEGRSFAFARWLTPDDLLKWLDNGAGRASSGDVYARRVG